MIEGSSNGSSGTSKIDRVIEKHDLTGISDELEDRWLGVDNTEQASTRELADYVNKSILQSAIKKGDTFSLSGDVEEIYRVITDGKDADATLVQSRLERSGINVENVTDDFISHQTVYRYLKEYRGVEQPKKSSEDQLEDAIETVQQLQGRTTAVTEQKIKSLKSKGIISAGGIRVLNDIQVLCENCGRSHDATLFFEEGGCGCEDK